MSVDTGYILGPNGFGSHGIPNENCRFPSNPVHTR
jgi:hypothetical protein